MLFCMRGCGSEVASVAVNGCCSDCCHKSWNSFERCRGGVILSAASTGSSRAFVFCVNFVIYAVMLAVVAAGLIFYFFMGSFCCKAVQYQTINF